MLKKNIKKGKVRLCTEKKNRERKRDRESKKIKSITWFILFVAATFETTHTSSLAHRAATTQQNN